MAAQNGDLRDGIESVCTARCRLGVLIGLEEMLVK